MTQILIDGITNISFHSGVLRIECATVAPMESLIHPAP